MLRRKMRPVRTIIYRSRQLSRCEQAYLACAIDSEGTLTILRRCYKNGKISYLPRAYITNTSYDFLLKLKEIVGAGSIVLKNKEGVSEDGYKRKTSWRFVFHVESLGSILPQIIRWLIVKRKQAELLLEFFKLRKKLYWGYSDKKILRRMEEIRLEVKRLNGS